MIARKKLIEVALPLEAINAASAREKSIRHGHPSTLHLWWARRPLAAARAVIFSQMVDDPSEYVTQLTSPNTDSRRAAERELRKRRIAWESRPDPSDDAPEPTLDEVAADIERQRLFRLIEDLVKWENTTNEAVLQAARDEIWRSWRRTCADNAGHPQAKELFNRDNLPAFHDPFAGGGALPLEAQRLGLEAYASDLNPVAVLINKAMIEIPPKFAGQPPVNPEARSEWRGERSESALSRDDRLAEGPSSVAGVVSPGTSAAEGGDVRHSVSDHARHSFDSSEHRIGMDAGVGQRESSIPCNSPGFVSRGGDTPVDLRADDLVSDGQDDEPPAAAGRSQSNAHCNAPQPAELSLTPHSSSLFPRQWKGAQGLAEDVRYYGKWMRDEAQKRIGHLYPKVKVTAEMVAERPDLKPYLNKELTVIAWLWARTVKSPNPAFRDVDVPLASTFMLSTKAGKEAYVEPVIENGRYRFAVKSGKPQDSERAKRGTKLARGANFECIMSGTPLAGDYIKSEGMAGRMNARLMAIVAEGERGRVYLPPPDEQTLASSRGNPDWQPDTEIPPDRRSMFTPLYGLTHFKHLFTPRQLVALTTFSDLVGEARERIKKDAAANGHANPRAYADAVGTYLGFGSSRAADAWSSIVTWRNQAEASRNTFARQAVPMTWDFTEVNPFSASCGNFMGNSVEWVEKSLIALPTLPSRGYATPADAAAQSQSLTKVVSTDPPYYDNIGYADLSDFFYVWLRRSLRSVYPDLFATIAVPKAEELVATPYRHGSRDAAEEFFLDGMTLAMRRICDQSHIAFPITIYYAFKQSESTESGGQASTGWETFLEAVVRSGFGLSGTWPMRTEKQGRVISNDTNALASSIVLVCRRRPANAPTATRRDFLTALERELPRAIADLQRGNVAPVDLQ